MGLLKNRRQGGPDSKWPFSRGFRRAQDFSLALAVVVACVGFFLFRQRTASPGATARVYLAGEEILRIPLSSEQESPIHLMEEYGVPVSFEIRDGEIRFVNVTCPDHICEKTGFISLNGQTAVCMPNQVVLQVFSE